MLAGALLAASPLRAESVWVGGLGASDDTRIVYLGRIAPLPGQRLGDGWAWSAFADLLDYDYLAGAGRIDADSQSLRLGVQRQLRAGPGTLGLGATVSARNTDLSPDDPGNRSRGFLVRPGLELQWLSDEDARWRRQFYSQYTFEVDSFYAKAFTGRRLGRGPALGPEVWAQGDPSYRLYGAGLVLNGIAIGRYRLTLRLGAEHQEREDTRLAGGLEFSRYFGD